MQIVIEKLGRGMALDGERQILARHAAAVIGDADEPPSAAREHDLDSPCARVERVSRPAPSRRGGPLDDLAAAIRLMTDSDSWRTGMGRP